MVFSFFLTNFGLSFNGLREKENRIPWRI